MMTNRRILTFVIFLCWILTCSMAAFGATANEAWKTLVGPKSIKHPEFAFVQNNPGLPNVLIYGDSISIGYTQQVRGNLKGKANVYRIYCNGGSSIEFIRNMTKMHETMRDKKIEGYWSFEWDVIHFNVGLQDLKYVVNRKLDKKNGKRISSTEEYKKNILSIISYLKQLAPKAKLIFATTTPVPEGEPGRFAGDELKYNEVALKALNDHPEIIVDDLYSFTKPNRSKWWVSPGNVHYGPEGRKAQGNEVARIILNELTHNPEPAARPRPLPLPRAARPLGK